MIDALLHRIAAGVSFPDFPGCITAGETLNEAHALAAEALSFHVEGMLADGEPLPAPTPLERWCRERAFARAPARSSRARRQARGAAGSTCRGMQLAWKSDSARGCSHSVQPERFDQTPAGARMDGSERASSALVRCIQVAVKG